MSLGYTKHLDIEDFLTENRSLVLDYLCPLCKGIYYKPVVDPCGSIYCRKCIEQCLEKTGTCPSGKSFGPESLITIDFITNVLDKLELFCKNKIAGCVWKGRLATLDEHLEKQCDYQCVRCINEECKTILRKSNLENHLSHCEYKKEKCVYCEVLFMKLNIPSHLTECPRMKIDCVQNCGATVERNEMDHHVGNVCSKTVIECTYQQLGCNYKETRAEVEHHLNENNVKHSLLFLSEITTMNSKIKEINNKFDEIALKLSMTGNASDEKKETKSVEKQVKEKYVPNFERKIFSTEIPNGNYYVKLFLGFQEKLSRNKVISKKRKRSESPSIKSGDIQEIDLDDNEDSSNTEDSKPDIIIESPSKKEKISKSIQSNTTHKTVFHSKEKELYREEITIDTLEISKGIDVKVNMATCVAVNKNEHKFAMANNVLNGSNCEWKVKVLKASGWMGIGVCLKELVVSNKLKFVGSKNNFMHGTFMISLNGYTWNTNEEEEDNTLIENFQKIKSGDEVECHFNDEKEQLKIFINGKFSVTLNNVNYPKGNCLVPCVIFLSPGDQVSFSTMTKY